MEKKTYVFHVSRGADKHEKFELTEDQLEPKHRKLLLGTLWKQWENTPRAQQMEFISKMAEDSARKVDEFITKKKNEFQERAELDDRIDEIIKYWKNNNKNIDDKLNRMIQDIERDYDYVVLTIYPQSKMTVKIHDGEQTFN